MKYRPEIDGLRSVAVIPVILFHAGFTTFSGGFVGVDVFFVISGYLITALILEDIEKNRFSLAYFYERRIRRIFPALFLVVAACFPAAWLLMLPDQLKDFSQSVISVIIFVSNVLFWRESGYFAGASELKPLLHTWSLAVEEQYYVIFPLLLVFLWRFGRTFAVIVLLVFCLVSLAATEWGWRNASTANFFLTPFRIWELLAGSLCAILLRQRDIAGSNFLGGVGIAMILAAIFLFDSATPFPSLLALVPVLGSCLCVIFARSGTFAARLLSTSVLVGIGLVSYSAYLWHQPLFAFARLASPYAPGPVLMLILSVLSLVLGYFTRRFVEQPFRQRRIPVLVPRRNIFALATVAAAVLLCVGVVGHLRDGFPNRFDPRLDEILALRTEWLEKRKACHVEGIPKPHPVANCLVLADHPKIDVAMIGDSHSLAISEVVQAALKENGLSSYAVSYTGCIGLPGFYRVDLDIQHECDRHNREMLEFIVQQEIGTVILTSRFPLYLRGERFNNGEGGQESGDPAWIDLDDYRTEKAGMNDEERRVRVIAGIRTGILELLEKVNIVLVYPIPEAGWDVVRYAVKETVRNGGGALKISTDAVAYNARSQEILDLFDSLEAPGLRKVQPAQILCDTFLPDRCINALGDKVYYRDEDHLSYEGVTLLAPKIVEETLSFFDN